MTRPNEGRITDQTAIGTGICHGDLCDEGEHEINLTDLSPEYRQILLNNEAQTARLNEAMALLDMTDDSDFFEPNCSDCDFYWMEDGGKLDSGEVAKFCEFHQRYEALKKRQVKNAKI